MNRFPQLASGGNVAYITGHAYITLVPAIIALQGSLPARGLTREQVLSFGQAVTMSSHLKLSVNTSLLRPEIYQCLSNPIALSYLIC